MHIIVYVNRMCSIFWEMQSAVVPKLGYITCVGTSKCVEVWFGNQVQVFLL